MCVICLPPEVVQEFRHRAGQECLRHFFEPGLACTLPGFC